MKYFSGLNVSLKETAVWVVDENGKIIREGKAGADPAALATWLMVVKVQRDRVGLEAGLLSSWLYDRFREGDYPAIGIETRRMKGRNRRDGVEN